ncbi:MAG: penicillin-binding protein 2, partial [Candidatus Competibacteraceae bacterium]|nr:penicillin-binding protein 2 [Candidatus Competibacteraceae bacterium]
MKLRRSSSFLSQPVNKIRDPRAEQRLFGLRALLAIGVVLGALLVLVARLYYLQVVHHSHFSTLAEDNRVSIRPLTPTRGLIFDRNGVLLADNLSSYRLEITPERVDDLEATLSVLGELIALEAQDIERFKKLLRRNPRHRGTPLRFGLTEEEVAVLAINLHRLPGVEILADLSRHYPQGAHGVHAIGYVGRINEQELQTLDPGQYTGSSHIGKVGVEKSYEALLRGRVGHEQVETNAAGRVLRVLGSTPPVPGQNLYLTLDFRLQQVAEAALGEHNGAVVALDPRNGQVLAMASQPVFDPNPFVNGIDAASFRALNNSPDRPMFNRAIRGTYPPGSTIKPFIGLGGLVNGVITPHTSVYCPGFFRLPGSSHRFRDWKRGGHGRTALDKAIHQSCDVYYYELASKLGIERLHDFLDRFNLGRPTGIDLVGERSGLVPSVEWKRRTLGKPWYPGETVIAGIGQGYMLTTPLQLAQATALLAMRGQGFKPHLLLESEDQATRERTPRVPEPLPPIQVDNPRYWDEVINGMIHVVHGPRGTARRIG